MACPETITDLQEMHFRIRVQLGGGLWKGIQKGDAELGLEPLILFDDPQMPADKRSTMCLKSSQVCAAAVRSAIESKRAEFQKFEAFADKATNRVFRYFGQKQAVSRAAMRAKFGECTVCRCVATPGHMAGVLHNKRDRIVAGIQCGETAAEIGAAVGVSAQRVHSLIHHIGGRKRNEPTVLAEAA
jgi:hypothetical protein